MLKSSQSGSVRHKLENILLKVRNLVNYMGKLHIHIHTNIYLSMRYWVIQDSLVDHERSCKEKKYINKKVIFLIHGNIQLQCKNKLYCALKHMGSCLIHRRLPVDIKCSLLSNIFLLKIGLTFCWLYEEVIST